jgi:tetratricopeptide (TPR) repeat protein
MAKVNFFKAKFPKIYRFFTDKSFKKTLRAQFLIIIVTLVVASIVILGADLLNNLQKQKELDFQRKVLTSELKTWESIAQKFPKFKDAYFELAVLAYRLGDLEKAKEYVNKALYLDPNFEKARDLQKLLSG